MPELPEVETVMRGLSPHLQGRHIIKVETRRPDLRFPLPKDFAARLAGKKIESLSRRAKYILISLQDGLTLLVHLGMTGRFTLLDSQKTTNLGDFYYASPSGQAADGPHDHIIFHLENGLRVVYNDPRRFGFMDLISGDLSGHKSLKSLGPEPLGNAFSETSLAQSFYGRKVPLKSALLDQRHVAGLGNIYVCEALFRSGLSPKRMAKTLVTAKGAPKPGLQPLVTSIREVLTEAIRAGGSTISDYQAADGTKGSFQQEFAVYDREGEACKKPGCHGKIHRLVQSGRSTFYCPTCQR
jgi:formamidopyrimidine-DNA glycosylase